MTWKVYISYGMQITIDRKSLLVFKDTPFTKMQIVIDNQWD